MSDWKADYTLPVQGGDDPLLKDMHTYANGKKADYTMPVQGGADYTLPAQNGDRDPSWKAALGAYLSDPSARLPKKDEGEAEAIASDVAHDPHFKPKSTGVTGDYGPPDAPADDAASYARQLEAQRKAQAQPAQAQAQAAPPGPPQASPSPSAGPARPSGPSALQTAQQGYDQATQGLQGAYVSQGQQAIKNAEAEAKAIEIGQKARQEEAAREAEAQKLQADRMDHLMAQTSEAQDELSKQHIDPDRYWKHMSTGSKVLSMIGVLLGGIGGGLNHTGGNVALDILNRHIDSDIMAQKADYDRGLTRVKGMENQYAMLRQRGLDDAGARRLLKMDRLEATDAELNKSQALGKGANANQQAQIASQQIQEQKAQLQLQHQQALQKQAIAEGAAAARQQQAEQFQLAMALMKQKDETTADRRLALKAENDLNRRTEKYGKDYRAIEADTGDLDLEKLEKQLKESDDEGLGYFGGLKAAIPIWGRKAEMNRNEIARLAQQYAHSQTGAQASDKEREMYRRIQEGHGSEEELKDFVSRMRQTRERGLGELRQKYGPDVEENFESRKKPTIDFKAAK